MKEELKKTYREFVSWVKYVREYKDNIKNAHQYNDYIDETSKLKEQINKLEYDKNMYETEIQEIRITKDTEIKKLKNIISNEKIDNDRKAKKILDLHVRINELEKQYLTSINKNQELATKIIQKELSRRKSAGKVGGLKAKISVLQKDIARANQKINWLSNNQKAPTKEEILAYELKIKKAEKKID